MKYIADLQEGTRISGIYLCKSKNTATTKAGKPYENVTLMDRTGTLSGKIWEPDSPGIGDFAALDYIDVVGDITRFNGALQISIQRARVAQEGEYDPADYLPTSKRDPEQMYEELLKYIGTVEEPHFAAVLRHFFVEDADFVRNFKRASAAKSIHHGFVGGLLEHTLGVARLCHFYAKVYPILDRDLLVTAAILHDIGKLEELSDFPANDYTDAGQLLGHIVIGTGMIRDAIRAIPDFPAKRANELLHCIISHHGELEYGSPKKPSLAEAVALSYADITDARMETVTELLEGSDQTDPEAWLGFQRVLESNFRRTKPAGQA